MKIFRFLIISLLYLICNTSALKAGVFSFRKIDQSNTDTETDTSTYVSPFHDDNERCLKCHGQATYEYRNDNLGRNVKALMCSERIVNREEFYRSNHKSFSCTDCH